MNTTVLRRVMVALLALVVVSVAALVYAFYALLNATTALDTAETQRVRSYQIAFEMRQSSDDLTRMARTFVNTLQPDFERQYYAVLDIRNGKIHRPKDYWQVYWDLVDANNPVKPREDTNDLIPLRTLMEQAGFSAKELELIEASEDASNVLAQAELQAMHMVKGQYLNEEGSSFSRLGPPDQPRAVQMLYGAEYDKAKRAVMAPLQEFFVAMEQRVEGQTLAARHTQRNAQILFFGLMGVSMMLIGVLIVVGRKQAQLEIAERTRLQKDAEDENERLNNSVISILQAVNQLSERDLTVKAPVTEDVIGTVSDSINQLTEETVRVLTGVTGIADQVAQVSTNVKLQAEKVAQTAEEERQSVNHMVESLMEATQAMDQVASMAEQSNQSADAATQVTNDALSTVNEAVRGMESIRETIAETEKRIKRLGDRSQEISGIVNLINTISERTHVLALNASMQAAVAGEAGRGFAVVAEEVQRLAESSRNATQQIATLVNNIQIETNETINTVNQTIGQVVQGSEMAQKAGEQMVRTQEITSQLVSQVRNIAQASEQQRAMSSQLLHAVQQIGESTEQTAQQIEAQNKETDMLHEAASQLVESVAVFKLPSEQFV